MKNAEMMLNKKEKRLKDLEERYEQQQKQAVTVNKELQEVRYEDLGITLNTSFREIEYINLVQTLIYEGDDCNQATEEWNCHYRGDAEGSQEGAGIARQVQERMAEADQIL